MFNNNISKLFLVFFIFYSNNTHSQQLLKKRNLIIGGSIVTANFLGHHFYKKSNWYKNKCCNKMIENIEKYTPTAYFKQNELEDIKKIENVQEKFNRLNKIVQELKEKKVYIALKSPSALKISLEKKIESLLLLKASKECKNQDGGYEIYTYQQKQGNKPAQQRLIIKFSNNLKPPSQTSFKFIPFDIAEAVDHPTKEIFLYDKFNVYKIDKIEWNNFFIALEDLISYYSDENL